MNKSLVDFKQPERDALNAQVQAFLSKGNQVKVVPEFYQKRKK